MPEYDRVKGNERGIQRNGQRKSEDVVRNERFRLASQLAGLHSHSEERVSRTLVGRGLGLVNYKQASWLPRPIIPGGGAFLNPASATVHDCAPKLVTRSIISDFVDCVDPEKALSVAVVVHPVVRVSRHANTRCCSTTD